MGMTATSMGIDFTFDELGKHFFANIEAYKLLAYSYVRNDTVAEDIVSDCFLRLWEHKDKLDPQKGDYRMYIVQIIKNACYEYIRMNSIHSKIQNNGNCKSVSVHWKITRSKPTFFQAMWKKSSDANSLRCRNSDGRSFPTAGSDL